ncbi:helix-turn-helix domain-containing protein [Lutimonas zeaxanthinifaciens]|uniref:helix-turn-helix domain-containing protein n=1 Tax=Lutimonas zeaxanthinifaciens TaxID=3060215 RepID=UPI00265CDB3F|nr:helix-turn-helix domain-containing protein [Lutimonas sp. YSD2104]WKK66249.1 helix-turn-helix domain-containing protein [Lutimonas sp. YSD2104]
MDLSLISYLSFLISFQLLFVGLFLISNKKGNRRNNSLLGSIFILIAWNMGDLTLQMNNVILTWDFLQLIDSGFFLLYGPIIYIYAQGVIFKDFKLSKTHLLHLIPYLFLTLFLFVAGNPSPKTSAEFISNDLPWQFYLGSILIYLHFYIYMAMTYRSLWKYRQVIKNKYSQIEQINLDWLSFALNTFVLITFISLAHNFVSLLDNKTVFLITLILLLIFIFYFVNKVILDALRQPEIFSGIAQKETSKYKGSNLTQSQIEEYKERLLDLFSTEKTFLDPQVSLKDLSEKLSISSKNLSQVINQSFDKSFFDFINSYRIREAQHIFKEAKDDKITILEVMFDVGFNSKSSFNTAFKKETGKTPTEFRKTM